MSEINAKMKANGYNPFGSDDPSSEQRRRRNLGSSMSSLSGGEERKGGCLATLLRVICCCFYSDLQHPLLSPSIVTHRKISRVVSTESLTKEGVAMSERPTYAHMMSREKLLHARAHNRLYSNHPNAPYTHTTDDLDERTPEEVDDIPEANCVRPTTGGVDNPARECYGSISINILGRQGRWVRAVVCSLSGLPWVGGSGGFMLEVSVEPGGRPRWMVLPHAHGPNVTVKLEAMVKGPRESKTKKKRFVKVSVWVCGRVWRHAAIGHALTPLNETPGTLTIPLHHHTQLTEDLGLVEVSLRCDYVESSAEVGNTVQGEVTLTVEVLRAKNLRPYHPGVLAKAAPSRMRDHVEVVCRVGLWVKGERVDRESSMPVQLPVTQNPVIRSRTVFILQRDSLQHAAIILKVLYTCRWGGEDTVGRVQLGPLLYLGTLPDQASQALTHDYKTSITLSHWGQALKTPGPTTMWHHLQL
ncbi:uncharacterized protein [Panulirus ornatus]|uniref:uncharacterized protein isoform X3 n=1 Tax=Panulirus ornatus TaxID=150431 RepID=UPI003A865966